MSKPTQVTVSQHREWDNVGAYESNSESGKQVELCEPEFPFEDLGDGPTWQLPTVSKQATPLLKTSTLKESPFYLSNNQVFMDRTLPPPTSNPAINSQFTLDYFVSLHKLVAAGGQTMLGYTPNHLGARIPLQHSKLKADRWRYHLLGYENVEICQYIEYGFPIGLENDQSAVLRSTYRNHGSAYQFYTYWDKFTTVGVKQVPSPRVHLSPIMTAP